MTLRSVSALYLVAGFLLANPLLLALGGAASAYYALTLGRRHDV